MSYIFEALKMAEQARRESTLDAPVSLLAPTAVEEPRSRRAWPPYLLVAGLVVATAALAIWLDPFRRSAPAAPEPPKAVAAPSVTAVSAVATAPVAAEAVQPPSSEPAPVAAVATPLPPPTTPGSPTATRSAPAAPAAPRATAQTDSTAEPATADGLPASVQKQLPPLVVSGHSRDGDVKFAIVNDKVMREGDEIALGLTIEKITDDGVVFAFKGHRFRR